MFLIIGYYLFSGGIFYIIFRYLIKQTSRIDFKSISLFLGYVNVALGITFLLMYFMNPSVFSTDVTISNQLLYILMAVFSTYFYLIAPGISMSNLALLYKQKKQALIRNNRFYLGALVNFTAVLCFGILTYQLFG